VTGVAGRYLWTSLVFVLKEGPGGLN